MNSKFMVLLLITLLSLPVLAAQNPPKPVLVAGLGHVRTVNCVAYSTDGRYVVTGSDDYTALLWDVATGSELRRFVGHQGAIYSVAFSPDNRYIATGSLDKTLRVWEVLTGSELKKFEGHTSVVTSIAFSPDSKYLLSGSWDKTARLWNIDTGMEIRRFIGHLDEVRSIAFSPDGRLVLTGSGALFLDKKRDSSARLWDVATGKELHRFGGFTRAVTSVAFSRDGRYALTCGKNQDYSKKGACLWDIATGREIHRLKFSYGDFFGINERFVRVDDTGNRIKNIQIWNAITGKEISNFQAEILEIKAVAFSPDGQFILTAGTNEALLFDIYTGAIVRRLAARSEGAPGVSFSANWKILLRGFTDSTAYLWDATTGTEIRRFGRHNWINCTAISPDGKSVLTGIFKTTRLWDINSGEEIHEFVGHSNNVNDVAFSPDGRSFIAGYWDGIVRMWDITTGKERIQFKAHPINLDAIAISPNGRLVATVGYDNIARLWDVARGKERQRLVGHSKAIFAVVFSPDGRYLLTGSRDKTARLWDTKSGKEVHRFVGHTGLVTVVAFSPDGRVILTGGTDDIDAGQDRTVRLWNAVTRNEILRVEVDGSLGSAAFSPDGRFFLTGCWDKTVQIWETATGNELGRIISFNDGTWAVIDREGRYDASNSGDIEGLHWVVGMEAIALGQFKERYYEPGLLAKLFGFNNEPLKEVETLTSVNLYPEIDLTEPTVDHPIVGIHLTNRGGGIGKVVVFVNDKEITADARAPNANPHADQMELAVDIGEHPYLVPGKDNTIRVKAYNAEGYLSSRNVRVIYKTPARAKVEPATLWGIVVGISEYHGDKIDLRFAAKDAVDLAQALKIGAHRLFGMERTFVTLLTTEKTTDAIYPNKNNLIKAFNDVALTAKATDILVVYLAGHGLTYGGQDGDYYFLTAEASSGNLKDEAVRQQRAISSQELTELIKKIPALKQVLILDTCHSGRFSQDMTKDRAISSSQIRAYERMKDRTGLHILAGAAADAVAYESSSYGQGILTYSLLLGMRGAALRDDEFIDISRLFQYSADQVPELAKNIGGIQRPILAMPYGGASFDVGRLTNVDKGKIPLANPRPLVLKSNFQDENRFIDHLGLTKVVNDSLREASFQGRDAKLIFVDAIEFPGAYSLAGRYHIENGLLTIVVRIFNRDQKVGEFHINGNQSEIDHIITRILQETVKHLYVTKNGRL